MPQLSNVSEKEWKRTGSKFFDGLNPFTISKLKSKEFVGELLIQKVSKMMQAWLILKSNVKKIRRCPMNQLKLLLRNRFYADDF